MDLAQRPASPRARRRPRPRARGRTRAMDLAQRPASPRARRRRQESSIGASVRRCRVFQCDHPRKFAQVGDARERIDTHGGLGVGEHERVRVDRHLAAEQVNYTRTQLTAIDGARADAPDRCEQPGGWGPGGSRRHTVSIEPGYAVCSSPRRSQTSGMVPRGTGRKAGLHDHSSHRAPRHRLHDLARRLRPVLRDARALGRSRAPYLAPRRRRPLRHPRPRVRVHRGCRGLPGSSPGASMGRPREQSRPRRFTDDAIPRTCVLNSGSHSLELVSPDAGQRRRSAAPLPGRPGARHVALKGTWSVLLSPDRRSPQGIPLRAISSALLPGPTCP